jgi:hypothetical protein
MPLSRLSRYVCLLASCYSPAASAQHAPATITVRLHNDAGIAPPVLKAAIAIATRVFEKAGVQTSWVACGPLAPVLPPGDPCAETPDALAFTVSIMPSVTDFSGQDALGFAMPFAANANHAGVFYSRVKAFIEAEGTELKIGDLLGYAIAHEVAHLILGSRIHSEGIMRADWRVLELRLASQRQLLFSAADAERLHRRMYARNLEQSSPSSVRAATAVTDRPRQD